MEEEKVEGGGERDVKGNDFFMFKQLFPKGREFNACVLPVTGKNQNHAFDAV